VQIVLSIGGTVFMIKTILFSGYYSLELKPARPLSISDFLLQIKILGIDLCHLETKSQISNMVYEIVHGRWPVEETIKTCFE
jgi:hypothetical protein